MNKAFFKNRNVFVTGCSGFLGSWLVKYLVEAEANVTGLVRDWVPRSKLLSDGNFNKINIVWGELQDYALIERILTEYEIDTVFHLAALTIVGVANKNPLITFESNIKGTWNILEACRKNPLVKRVLVASSDKAYGEQAKLPYDENAPLEGNHPYDVSKSCADLLCKTYHNSYKLPVCVTRCGNFYGGGDLNFNRIIPGTILSVLNNQQPIIRSDGTFIRDYFYIEDGVEAYLLLAEKMEELKIQGEAFNFSSEIRVTVKELVEKIIKLMGSNLKPIILNEASNEIINQYLSAEKAHKKLNWQPKYTLDESLKKAIAWYTAFNKRR
ncbi:MAG: GDP-mannose 4,6-dehydratase [Elusimicrobia bacterium]|nr:GDP-mannose 4,6-dehydratase [Elusimicrobiota bacterium]